MRFWGGDKFILQRPVAASAMVGDGSIGEHSTRFNVSLELRVPVTCIESLERGAKVLELTRGKLGNFLFDAFDAGHGELRSTNGRSSEVTTPPESSGASRGPS